MTFWTEEVTISLPSSCTKVDAGHWRRSPAHEGLLRSVRDNTVAALCCCTRWRIWRTSPDDIRHVFGTEQPEHGRPAPGEDASRSPCHADRWPLLAQKRPIARKDVLSG